MNKNFFIENRKKLAKKTGDNTLVVMFAGSAPYKRGDEFYPFAPKRNFYYLTGLDAPEIIFTLRKDKKGKVTETLYLERFDETAAKWVGEPLSEDAAKAASGIEEFKFIDEFDDDAANCLFNHSPEVFIDLENRSLKASATCDVAFAAKLREKFPAVKLTNLYPVMAEFRAIKTDDEIKAIKKAIGVTKDGIYAMMRRAASVKNGTENYLEALFDFELKTKKAGHAFQSIIAAGENATVLHYNKNDGNYKENDLILCDVGAQIGWYAADVTRTFPAGGKFTERQKQIYEIVLEAHSRTAEAIKAGVVFKSLNDGVKNFYVKSLKKIGLIQNKEELEKYYYHGVSHPLGLETHDAGRGMFDNLKAGMVVTVEPGLYIAEEGLGIRIEDDVLVTEKGREILSADVIRTVAEIEGFMANI